MMKYTDNEMSAILLNSYLGITADSEVKPLSLGEWNRFFDAILKAGLEPRIVFDSDGQDLRNMGYDKQFTERINRLVDRGAAVAFELQEYEKRGIGVVTEINRNYPKQLRRVLDKKKPPVLFYAGNLELAGKMGIGVVGSRNISVEGFEFTRKLVEKASRERMVIFSGGAKGVDTTSETAAMNSRGAVVSFIADSLVSKIRKADTASNIARGSLLLLSDQKPDSGFSAARAMNRNKYIYALAYGTFVVESDYNKGGTWSGAQEALKKRWGKVFVNENNLEGNRKLIELGGIPYHISDLGLAELIESIPETGTASDDGFEQMDIMSFLTTD